MDSPNVQTSAPEEAARARIYERRTFLDYMIRGSFWITVAGTVYPLLSYFWPSAAAGLPGANEILIPVGDLPVGKSKKMPFKADTVIVARVSETEAIALSAVCTHLGCLVSWKADTQQFICPCHAAKFNADGTVAGGPPPRPLPAYKVRISGGNIAVKA